jgi:hypothetical protein
MGFLLVAVTGVTAGCCALLLYFFEPGRSSFYPICFFHQATGLLCPGCGSLRAMHQLLHGHFLAALRDNLLLVSSLPMLGAFGLRYAWLRSHARPIHFNIQQMWIWMGVALFVVFAVLRNVPSEQFAWMRP